MDIGTALSVAQSLLSALASTQLQDVRSILGYKSQLNDLSSLVITIKKILLDAEAKHDDELLQGTLHYVEKLKGALYDADDLLDEFATVAKRNELNKNDKFIKKVRLFFSRDNQLGFAYNMSREVKKIMNKLDSIATEHSKFGLSIDPKPSKFGLSLDHHFMKERETCSTTHTEIIGRGDDVEKIVQTLLHSDDQKDVSFLTIVGIGGLGKTALAQMVFNHEKITKEYPLRLWTCVSDHNQSNLDVKTILAQIVHAATGDKHLESSMEVVVNRLQELLAHKRFLIVLDDLWTESRNEMTKLVGHLVGGSGGSQVVVTTRSKETAKIVGNGLMYELKGLSEDNSWRLFQQMAFGQVLDQVCLSNYIDYINIGKEIVKICVNVPLAIRVIGSLLYGQEKRKWVSVQEVGLATLKDGKNGIKPVLKLSYYNLESRLKTCFSYCALYPKDFEIRKDILISLWIAQGYVEPLVKGESTYDTAEEYFSILLQRCFFQDILRNKSGEIYSFKLHDLMHDIASEVSEKEIYTLTSYPYDAGKVVRHISLMSRHYMNCYLTKAHIRTYIHCSLSNNCEEIPIDKVLGNYKYLRALNMSQLSIKSLSPALGKLIHLRYLDLSNNYDIEVLPKSLTKLYNLQTLNLENCWTLKELPNDLSKLVDLLVLKLTSCNGLRYMPSEMGKLAGLCKLSNFVVGEREQHAALESLKALKKLRGSIVISIYLPKSDGFVQDENIRDMACMRDKENLLNIKFEFKPYERTEAEAPTLYEEELLGLLQPHGNLKVLELKAYHGVRMPSWAQVNNLATFLPNLVRLGLEDCMNLQCFASLGKLYHLKYLTLRSLPNLEYVESPPTAVTSLGSSNKEVCLKFLPSLEELKLYDLAKLKEWCRISSERVGGDTDIKSSNEPLFLSQLKLLVIVDCPELTSLPDCSNVEKLNLRRFNERLRFITNCTSGPKLREVVIDNLTWLQCLVPMGYLQFLDSLVLRKDMKVESLSDAKRVFQACSSSLRNLEIDNCPNLKSVSTGLCYLSALESLTFASLHLTNLAEEEIVEDGDGMPWGSLYHTLLSLNIYNCKKLQSIPKWMRKFTFLQNFYVMSCSKDLFERCLDPIGEDRPNIQHIPDVVVSL